MTTVVPISALTEMNVAGQGVFDVLMRATKVHLEQEYSKNRIKGAEYATVYLGSLQSVMNTALEFLLQREKVALEAELMAQQVLLAQAGVAKANAEVELMREQVSIAKVELEIKRLGLEKLPAEIAHLEAQTAMVGQQKINLQDDLQTAAKNRAKLDSEIATQVEQRELIKFQAAHTDQQTSNLVTENLRIVSQTRLVDQQTANALKENAVLVAQECKLRAEYDLLMLNKEKVSAETSLLTQKTVTERAQTTAVGVDPDSVVGKQKNLYQAQTDGFARDAEQKVAKLMSDFWNVQRTTDEGKQPSDAAGNTDAYIGRAIKKMLEGVQA